jgi:hypothetical protein
VSDHDARAQHRHRHTGAAQKPLDLAAAAQVPGQLVTVLAQAAEVDDPVDPGRGSSEGARRIGVLALEVRVVQGVHQVVGDLAALECLPQRSLLPDVSGDRAAGRPAPT